MATPKEHIEEIRRKKFFIGEGEPNPLIQDLHYAVMNLSSELYAKDVHFLMELIQNAEDNQYLEGVDPTLEFILTSKDITGTGAPATLLIFNNEKGFSPRNIESICSVGRSTKKGNRINGYIGEKGIGFKSVFLISRQPYVFSNGYQIRFSEDPCSHCGLGYIVPEWVDENPTLAAVKQIYSACGTLPTTTIVLPLKPDKVKAVKQQLSSVHGEILLFLSKIKRLLVREKNENPKHNTLSAVAISSEINFMTRKNINAESYTLHLSEEENGDSGKECGYYVWKQKFPVRPEYRVQRRMDVQEWVVTLAFPNHERLQRGKTLPGIYAFLPTEMVTNFPFIIQADFVLASSRETILLDDKWNQGILDCVSSAFMGAFKSLVFATDTAPVPSLPRMFQFLPVTSSAYKELNTVRDKILAMLLQEKIVPIETYKQQKHFYKPGEVSRLRPRFWDILTEASEQGIYYSLSSHGRYILNSSFDKASNDQVLNFLGVRLVQVDWYTKCIQSSNLVERVSEDVYLKLLLFIAKSRFSNSSMMNIPLIKYVGSDGSVSHFSLNECTQKQGAKRIFLADQNYSHLISWLIDWNKEFTCASNCYFMPKTTQQAIWEFRKRKSLMEWLTEKVNVSIVNVNSFAKLLCKSIKNNRRLAVLYAHFLYYSFSNGYLTPREVDDLCGSMPLVGKYGHVSVAESRVGVIVPANLSKWAELAVTNQWRNEGYVELGEDYLHPCRCAGQFTCQQDPSDFLKFLATRAKAYDIPQVPAPSDGISGVEMPLTKENAFILLDWIQSLKHRGTLPERFLKCIKNGCWLKVTENGYRPPSQSFLIDSKLLNILQNSSVLVDIALVDQDFYGDQIWEYKEELKTIGVMFEYGEACQFIGKQLMSHAASFTLSEGHVLLILSFIQYLRKSFLPADDFVNSIRGKSWLKTSHGYRSPVGSVLHDSEWITASQITDIPFIDQAYYGEVIYNFKEELKVLGVIIGFSGNYQLVIDHLKLPLNLIPFTAEAVLLMLECMRHVDDPDKLVNALQGTKLLTHAGYRSPDKCLLFGSKWKKFLKPKYGPFIDENFYGHKIVLYRKELVAIGVIDDVEKGCSLVASHLDSHSEYSTIVQIYWFLNEYDWKPEKEAVKRVWIPKGDDNGEWVNSEECVLHDQDDLFGSKLHILENHYDKALLSFFSSKMSVRSSPSLDDYIELWKEWESSVEQLSHDKCHKFWTNVLQHKNKNKEKILAESLVKLPAASGADGILLLDKRDVFVVDNLHLKNLFEQERVFVWYPNSILTSWQRSKLLDLYKNIGVRTISESVQKEESSLLDGVKLKQVEPRNVFIGKVLVKLILGFLASSVLTMEAERRHEAVQGLLDLTVYETTEPITVSYSLLLSSGDIITKKSNRMIRWDRDSSKLFTQKIRLCRGNANVIKYATYFSDAISVGVLCENDDHVPALSEIIKLAFLMKFDEAAVDFLMESKDLQILLEDEEFLSSAFPVK